MKSNKPFFIPLDEQLELGFLLIMLFSIISAWKDWWHGGNGYLHMSIFCLITLLRMLYYKYVDVWLNINNILTKPKIMSIKEQIKEEIESYERLAIQIGNDSKNPAIDKIKRAEYKGKADIYKYAAYRLRKLFNI